jgi:hypothetical protein
MPSLTNILKNYVPGLFAPRAPARAEQKESVWLELPAPLGLTDFLALDIPREPNCSTPSCRSEACR